MKRTIVMVLAAACLCMVLCGCGDTRVRQDDMGMEPDIIATPSPMLPEVSPMVTPDVDDGIVKDTDGEIEDNDTGTGIGNDTTKTPGMTATSPSPQPTSKP